MFGSIGVPELILIFVVALLLFGPRKLPEIGRSLGKAMGEFKRATNDFKRTIEEEVAADDLRQAGREIKSAISLTPEGPPQPSAPTAPAAPHPPVPPGDQPPASDKPLEHPAASDKPLDPK